MKTLRVFFGLLALSLMPAMPADYDPVSGKYEKLSQHFFNVTMKYRF